MSLDGTVFVVTTMVIILLVLVAVTGLGSCVNDQLAAFNQALAVAEQGPAVETVPGVARRHLAELCASGLGTSVYAHDGRTLTVRRVGAVLVNTPTARGSYGEQGPGQSRVALPVRFDGDVMPTVLENRTVGDRPRPGDRLELCVVDDYGTTNWWPRTTSMILMPIGNTVIPVNGSETGPPVGPFDTARWITDVE